MNENEQNNFIDPELSKQTSPICPKEIKTKKPNYNNLSGLIIFASLVLIFLISLKIYQDNKDFESGKNRPAAVTECVSCSEQILEAINNIRSEHEASNVKVDYTLEKYAIKRAKELDGEMDNHEGFKDLVNNKVFNSSFLEVAENLGHDPHDPFLASSYIDGWMKSTQGHRETMLNSKYKKIGVSYYKGVVVTIYGESR